MLALTLHMHTFYFRVIPNAYILRLNSFHPLIIVINQDIQFMTYEDF